MSKAFFRSILGRSHEVQQWRSRFRQYGIVHGSLETVQTFRWEETPVRHGAANFGGSAREFRHSAVFGDCFAIRRSANNLDSVHTNS